MSGYTCDTCGWTCPDVPCGLRMREHLASHVTPTTRPALTEPATEAGRTHLASWFMVGSFATDQVREAILAIEAEAGAAAVQRERERLRALYMATDAGEFCNIDVFHDHKHQGCNARCWCSWADPENCPYPERED